MTLLLLDYETKSIKKKKNNDRIVTIDFCTLIVIINNIGGVFLEKEGKKSLIKIISVTFVGVILILMVPILFNYFF